MAVLLVERAADINSKTIFSTTPLDAAKADNPFVQVGQMGEFLKNREFIYDYLAANGGKSGSE